MTDPDDTATPACVHEAGAQVHYVALGDSSTEGLCDPDGNGGWIGWSQRLAHRFAQRHGEAMWANLALRGMTCREILTTQLADAVALHPTHATVFGGMNDLLRVIQPIEDTIADLRTLLRTMSATGATVATMTIPDLSEVMTIARPLRSRLDQLNDAIRQMADEGIVVVDIADSPIAGDERLWAEDRLHANAAGHSRIADAMANAFDLPHSDWNASNFDRDPISWTWQDHRAWRRDHLYPWLARRIRRESSADGIQPRHAEWLRITAGDDLRTVSAAAAGHPRSLDGAPQPTAAPLTAQSLAG